jgi:hypothetical protein
VPGISRHDDYAFEQGITAPTVLSAFTAKSSRRPRYMSREELEKIWDGRVIIVAPKRPRKDTGIDAVIGHLKIMVERVTPFAIQLWQWMRRAQPQHAASYPLGTMANRTRREKGLFSQPEFGLISADARRSPLKVPPGQRPQSAPWILTPREPAKAIGCLRSGRRGLSASECAPQNSARAGKRRVAVCHH